MRLFKQTALVCFACMTLKRFLQLASKRERAEVASRLTDNPAYERIKS
jgi:hypothetical protein